MESEQPETIQENTTETSFSSVLAEGLKQGAEVEAVSPQQTEEAVVDNQAQVEQLFAELVVSDQNKIGFKSEKEFSDFIDKNKPLKEGWMRTQDYTRKTQEVANQRKEFESKLSEFESLWGDVKPNETSLQGLKAIWNAYQNGTPEYQQELNSLVGKAVRILQGEQPTSQAQTPSFVNNPKLTALEQKVSQFENMFEKLAYDKADNEWNVWKSTKEKSGNKISEDIEGMMAHFLGFVDPKNGKPFTLDKAYDYAVRELGLEKVNATKQVFQDAKTLKTKTPNSPNSNISGSAKPEPKNFGELLKQAADSL